MDTSSPLEYHLLDYLGEDPFVVKDPKNLTTLLRHGQIAQEWLVKEYLGAWLELVGGVVEASYPLALRHRVLLRSLARYAEHLDPSLPTVEQVSFLTSLQLGIQGALRLMSVCPSERDMQWGLWGRDVPMAIAYGCTDSEVVSPIVCEAVSQCCMYAALLVSQCVTDDGVAEEIVSRMFEAKPRTLLELLRATPDAPEA